MPKKEIEHVKATNQMAAGYRQKIYEELQRFMTPTDYHELVATKKLSNIDLIFLMESIQTLKKQAKERELAQKDLKECTFKPKTNDYQPRNTEVVYTNPNESSSGKRSLGSQGSSRAIGLYQLASKKEPRRDRHPTEIEYERQCDELTFIPNIESSKRSVQAVKKGVSSKHPDFDKTIQRMRNAQKDREIMNGFKERGKKIDKKERMRGQKPSSNAGNKSLNVESVSRPDSKNDNSTSLRVDTVGDHFVIPEEELSPRTGLHPFRFWLTFFRRDSLLH
jgi:hypothetical protein